MQFLVLLVVLSTCTLVYSRNVCDGSKSYYKTTQVGNQWTISPGSGGVADIILCGEMNSTGWDFIKITTRASASNADQAFAAGFIEGATTYTAIWNSIYTTNQSYSGGGFVMPNNVKNFILQQVNWLNSMVQKNPSSPYWNQVKLILVQLDGLYIGYKQYAPASMNIELFDLIVYQLGPEVGDIFSHFAAINGEKLPKPVPGLSHCSVLVKVSDDGKSLLAAHDTWSSFTSMLRTFKIYDFHYKTNSSTEFPGSRVSFSSYPGSLQSTDDFYVTSSQLVAMETTNDVMNDTLYRDFIGPETVPEWIRIIIANRLASSGREWSSIYSQYNSGTYNNQWQIVDYKLFVPGRPIQPNTLWILEQIPGYVMSADKSDYLVNQKYWPSYNIPYFPFIYNVSGYPSYFAQYGNTYSYEFCARANIFRRDQHKVQDVPTMKTMMRYNKYQTDTFSLQDACRGISARCDLNTPWINNTLNGVAPFGGIDSKMVDQNMVAQNKVEIVSGPTWDSQPPFAWTDQWAGYPHYGQPTLFAFDWITVVPVQ